MECLRHFTKRASSAFQFLVFLIMTCLPHQGITQALSLDLRINTWSTTVQTEPGDIFTATQPEFLSPLSLVATGEPIQFANIPGEERDSFLNITKNGSQLESFHFVPGTVLLSFETEIGQRYSVQFSLDLIRWSEIQTIEGLNQTTEVELETTGTKAAFYRVVRSEGSPTTPEQGALFGFVYQNIETKALQFGSALEAPEGTVPAEGGLARIAGTDLQTEIDEDGRYTFFEAPAGSIQVTAQKDDQTITESFHIYADLDNTPYSHFLSRDEAFALLETSFLNEFELRNQSMVIGLPQPIPTGSIVDRADEDIRLFDASALKTEEEPAWLFIIDAFEDSQWQHPIVVALVGDESGEVNWIPYMELPSVNGVMPWISYDDLKPEDILFRGPKSPGVFKADVPADALPPLQPQAIDQLRELELDGNVWRPREETPVDPCKGKSGALYALFLNAGYEKWSIGTVNRIKRKLKPDHTKTIPFTAGKKWSQQYKNILKGWFKTMGPCDTLAVIFSGHGVTVDDPINGILTNGALPVGVNYFGSKQNNGGTGRAHLYPSEIMTPLKGLPACKLMIYVDSCFSGSFVITGGFQRIKKGPKKGQVKKIVSPLTDYIPTTVPKSVDVLVFSSADAITTSIASSTSPNTDKFLPGAVAEFFGLRSVSLVAKEFIDKGIFNRPLNFETMAALIKEVKEKEGTQANSQGALHFHRKPDPTVPCGTKLIPEEKEDNDSKETATPVKTTDGEGGAIGSLDRTQNDVDHFVFEENADFFKVSTEEDHQITVEKPDGSVVQGEGSVSFRLVNPGQFFVAVSGGSVKDYELSIFPIASAIRLENRSTTTYGMRLVTNELPVNQDALLILRPGDVFTESFPTPVTGFNMIDFQNTDEIIRGGDQGFAIPIPLGTQQVFIFHEGFEEFFPEPIR